MSTLARRQWSTVMLLGLAMSVLLALTIDQVDATPIASSPATGSTINQQQASALQGIGETPNSPIDKLINDFIDEAGQRLKKSKINSVKSLKSTLRFGRRSDPSLYTEAPDAFDLQRLVAAYRLPSSLQELLQDDNVHDPMDDWHRERYLASQMQARQMNELAA